jgi:hypothetical protein
VEHSGETRESFHIFFENNVGFVQTSLWTCCRMIINLGDQSGARCRRLVFNG